MQKRILGVMAGLCVVIVCFFTLAFFFEPNHDQISLLVADSLNIPLASIGGQIVSHKQFSRDLSIVRQLDAGTSSINVLEQRAFDRIVSEYLIGAMALEQHITWTATELHQFAADYIQNTVGTDDLLLSKTDTQYLEDHLVLPILLREKLNKIFLLDRPNDARTQIEQLNDQLKRAPENFDQILTQYRTDNNLTQQDVERIIVSDQLSDADRTLLRSLKKGDTTPIIVSQDGYRIYKIENYFTDPQEAWQLLELFIPSKGFESIFTEFAKKVPVSIFPRSYQFLQK